MAQPPDNARDALKAIAPVDGSESGSVELPLFRFGLKQLLWSTTFFSVLLACIVSADGITATVILLASLVVAAHLFSTSLGGRLRTRSDEQHSWRGGRTTPTVGQSADHPCARDLNVVQFVSRSPWHGRGSTPLPWLRRLIATSAVASGMGGAVAIAVMIGHRTSFSGILLGSVSLAVLGGWLSFLGGSFYGIFRHGLRDALAEQRSNVSASPLKQ